MIVRLGRATKEIPDLARELGVAARYANRDYEPAAKRRDNAIRTSLRDAGIAFHSFKDQAIFDRDDVLTLAGKTVCRFHAVQKCLAEAVDRSRLCRLPLSGRSRAAGACGGAQPGRIRLRQHGPD